MATKQIIKSATGPTPIGPYNVAVRVGELLFCSGQIPVDPTTGQLVGDDIRTQTDRVLQNIKNILAEQNLSLANVVKTTVYLADLDDFTGMNEVYARYFATDYPARSTVEVSALPKGAKVEIEVIAHY